MIKLDTAAWIPWLNQVVEAMLTLWTPENIVLRTSRHVAGANDGSILLGAVPDGGVVFKENGLRFVADVIEGNKTGHFLDQRDNRALVQGFARDCEVLDLFCSNGGFSVYAAAGGASSVTSVDISKAALAACRIHMASNAPEVAHQTECGDAFEVLDRLRADGRQFGVVVVDPPSFASKAADVSGALRAYAKLTTKALSVLKPGGVLVQASCSSRVEADSFFSRVIESAPSVGRPIDELHRTFHAADHPIGFPQGGYLKAIFGTA